MLILCVECGNEISDQSQKCSRCGCPTPRQCPRCHQYAYVGNDVTYHRDAVTKSVTKANLNPLKPFTIATTKEKVVRPEINVTKFEGVCKNCGYPKKDTRMQYRPLPTENNSMSKSYSEQKHLMSKDGIKALIIFAIVAVLLGAILEVVF